MLNDQSVSNDSDDSKCFKSQCIKVSEMIVMFQGVSYDPITYNSPNVEGDKKACPINSTAPCCQ